MSRQIGAIAATIQSPVLQAVSSADCWQIRARTGLARGFLAVIATDIMTIDLHPKEALITVAKTAKLPVAFLVGAPLSIDREGGVPGVAAVLDFVREEIRATAISELSRFETAITGKASADAYQTAIRWLQGNLTQDAVNRVVQKAVLQARAPGAADTFELDGDPSDWHLPAGTRQLAHLTCRQSERFPGPILTTNFDPLISRAIYDTGGRPRLRVIDSDGGLSRDVEIEPGVSEVVHLHGYWRGSDTLHTPAQLTGARPKLKASLQKLLQQRTLIVAAYGGWDDVFTRALENLLNSDEAQLNVLWCFYDSDAAVVEARYQGLLERVAPAITRGRFLTYGGIDCHSIFAEIADFAPRTPSTVSLAASPLAGWQRIDSAYLAGLLPLRPEETLRYFNGAVPTWRHATSDAIPRRHFASKLTTRLNEVRVSKDECSLQLIRAAGGEGKSTLLLQVAADAARTGDWIVLWRPARNVGLAPEHVITLDASKQWLIVADDAENLVPNLSNSARLLHASGRMNVHFLLAARDADWRAAGGDRRGWASWLNMQPEILLRGITHEDALAIVRSWGEFGEAGLKELSKLPNLTTQAEALVHAVSEASKQRREGSFFGGLLFVRFGEGGLQAHVREFLSRLREIEIEDSDRSLFDALLNVAACHGVGIPGLDENVLADLAFVPRQWVQSRVVRPLGEEAVAVQSAGHVFTRHSKVAAAILVEAEEAFGADIAEIWSALVRQTVRTSRDVHVGHQSHPRILHAGPRLQRDLPKELSEQRRKDIAFAAAKASIAAEPNRLSRIVDLGKTHRLAGDLGQAVKVFRDNMKGLSSKLDFRSDVRGYWYEWGVCEGSIGDDPSHRAAGAWLQGLSLSDLLKRSPVTEKDAKLICAGLGVAFGKLAQPAPDCAFARARRAVAYLGRLTNPDRRTAGYFTKHNREADKIGTPYPQDIEQAIAWLTSAVAEAGREVQDPFLKSLAKPDQVSFNMLRKFFNNAA